MAVPQSLSKLGGQWAGTNRLLISPDDPAAESSTTLTASFTGRGKFLTLHYTWAFEGETQEGLLVLGEDPGAHAVTVSWVDSFHTAEKVMIFQGAVDASGSVVVKGSYSIDGSPEWGWQITLRSKTDDAFDLIMHNISPEGQHYLAVEAAYTRTA